MFYTVLFSVTIEVIVLHIGLTSVGLISPNLANLGNIYLIGMNSIVNGSQLTEYPEKHQKHKKNTRVR